MITLIRYLIMQKLQIFPGLFTFYRLDLNVLAQYTWIYWINTRLKQILSGVFLFQTTKKLSPNKSDWISKFKCYALFTVFDMICNYCKLHFFMCECNDLNSNFVSVIKMAKNSYNVLPAISNIPETKIDWIYYPGLQPK